MNMIDVRNLFSSMSRNPLVFGKQFMSDIFYLPFAEFQKKIVKFFLKSLESPGTIFIAEVPRGFGKSVIISLLLVLWAALFFKLRYIVLFSMTAPKAQQLLNDVRDQVKKPIFKHIFGDLMGKKDSVKSLHLYSEEHGIDILIESAGLDSQVRGLRRGKTRIQLALVDDPEEDEDADNPTRITKKVRRIVKTIEPALEVNMGKDGFLGKIWWCGTPLERDCVLRRVKEFKDAKTITFPCMINGKSIWEDKFSTEWLIKKRQYLFSRNWQVVWWAEYMCDPREAAEMTFRGDIKEFVPEKVRDVDIPMFLALDAAYTTKRKNCETGLTVGGRDAAGNLYSWENVVGRFIPQKLGKIIADFIKKYAGMNRPIKKVGIESSAFEIMKEMLRRLLWEEHGITISIVELKHKNKPKEDHIMELIPIHDDGRLFIREEQNRLKEQMLNFPSLKGGIDGLDSFAHLKDMAVIPGKKEKKEVYPPDSVDADIHKYLVKQRKQRKQRERMYSPRRLRFKRGGSIRAYH